MRVVALTFAPLLILAALLCGLAPLLLFGIEQDGQFLPDAYAFHVLWFTIKQASLSTLLSVGFAVPIARALARQAFPGRSFMIAMFGVPLALPVIVSIFGLSALFGTSGILSGAFPLYGLYGIVLAHVFFNLPLAVRLALQAMQNAPTENHRLAAQLGFRNADVFRLVDWPALKPVMPHIIVLVFMLCAASFVVVLLLGGPAATTLEVAIYQSLRMDFDVARALTLSTLQLCLSLILVITASAVLRGNVLPPLLRLEQRRYDGTSLGAKCRDFTLIAAGCLLVFPVLAMVLVGGISHIELTALLGKAFATSAIVGIFSVIVVLPLAWGLAKLAVRAPRLQRFVTALGFSAVLVPPAVLATGWFLLLRHTDFGMLTALLLVAAMNALMALPFVLSQLMPALANAALAHDKLCAQLCVKGLNRLRMIELPALRGILLQSSAMAFLLSLGDLTAITLLGTQHIVTLPSLVQQQMGHYQSQAAGGTALLLGLVCFALSAFAQRFSRWT